MSTEGIIAGAVVGIVVGVVSTVVTHKSLCKADETIRNDELQAVHDDAWREGWSDASNSANNIRQCYQRLFGSADEEAGTTTKASRKG